MGVDRLEQRDGGASGDARGEQAGLGGGAGDVVKAGVRDVHPGQLTDDGLVLEGALQRALADLGLIGRVSRDELGAVGEVARDRGHGPPVRSGAEEARPRRVRVLVRSLLEQADQLRLGEGSRQRDRGVAKLRRQLGEQLVAAREAEPAEHDGAVGVGGGDVGVRRAAFGVHRHR